MAKRPVFLPKLDGFPYVKTKLVEFRWHPGFSTSQVRKSIRSLHKAAELQDVFPILEISGKSESPLGRSLSAFNLTVETPGGQTVSVECAFQGSKVFEGVGPYHDLYSASSREAKTDRRLRNSGEVVAFNYFGEEFPTEPQTAFYDWLYMTALTQRKSLRLEELLSYKGFSDIAFNPKRSISCQASAAALFVALNHKVPGAKELLRDWDSYRDLVSGENESSPPEKTAAQLSIPLEKESDSSIPPNSNRETDRAGKHRSEHR